jgi:hypothetical protein
VLDLSRQTFELLHRLMLASKAYLTQKVQHSNLLVFFIALTRSASRFTLWCSLFLPSSLIDGCATSNRLSPESTTHSTAGCCSLAFASVRIPIPPRRLLAEALLLTAPDWSFSAVVLNLRELNLGRCECAADRCFLPLFRRWID